jgi:hypothetical protein
MAWIHVAAVDTEPGPVLAGVRKLGAERVLLVAGDDDPACAEAREALEPLGIETETRAVEGSMLTGTLQLVQDIALEHGDRREDLVVNLASAGRYRSCALLSAAFVAGVRAIDRSDGEIRFLPALNFSYERLVGAEELEILEAIDSHEAETPSLDEVARATSLNSGAVSYLIRGGEDAEGLEPLGLVDIASTGEGVGLRLTPMGDTLAESMTVRPGPTSG